jgi:hypothetical protein
MFKVRKAVLWIRYYFFRIRIPLDIFMVIDKNMLSNW